MNSTRPILARIRWYWPLQILVWHGVALFNLMFYWRAAPGWQIIAVCWWAGLSGILCTHWWRAVLRRRPHWLGKHVHWKYIGPSLMLLIALQTASMVLAFAVFRPMGAMHGVSWLPGALIFWFLVLGLWTLLYMAVLSVRRANRYEAETLRLELHVKDTELRALQAQVNPHFFFNSMNSVRALIYEDQHAAARMIDQLASLMRYALQSGHADTVTLAAEMEAVQAYLAIEKIRFEERMRVSVQVEAGLEQVRIPPMALQTLVENAVKYGVETNADGSEIRIVARRVDGMIRIEIANAGAIVPYANSTKVGLVNTRKRLALALGASAHLDLSENGGWVRATLTMPANAIHAALEAA